MKSFSSKNSKGYTLLFSVLTAVLVLGVAVFILSVSKKQYALAVAARESTFAIYSADSGIECASASDLSSSTAGTFYCNSHAIPVNVWHGWNGNLNDPTPTYNNLTRARQSDPIIVTFENGQCAVVVFTTGLDSNGQPRTIVDSSGYNVCNSGGAEISSSRIVERALRLTTPDVW